MTGWSAEVPELDALEPAARARLDALHVMEVPAGTVLFQPGDAVKGYVVVLGAGTGNPYFTTDTAGALRATEINAEVMIKATKVNGVYDSDPLLNPQAKLFDHITYMDALNMRLKVLDATALTTCMDNDLPILVLNLWDGDSLERAVQGEHVGTLISH